MDTFVARQPIFTQKEEVHAYELLFRSSLENSFGDVDGDQASAKVLVDGVLGLGMSTLTGGKAAFINFTRDLLLKDMAFLFPKEQVVIELLEDVEPDDSVFEACVRLKLQGYCLALDDFIFDPKYDALISLADIIKVDFLLSGPEERRRLPGLIKNKKIQFLAEKVESREEFEEALELGYTYFQGYFFSKPVVLSHKQIPSFKFSYLQLLQAVRVPNLDFSEIENIVKGDPALTSKLLRYINTAGRGLVTYIDSIKHSLTLLGRENLRRLFCLVVLSTVMEDRAQELLVQSLIRASVCESLAGHIGMGDRKFDFFLMGMFSSLDAVLGLPMDEAVTHVPLPEEAQAALLNEGGPLQAPLEVVLSYERAEWETFSSLASELGVSESLFPGMFLSSTKWAEEIVPSSHGRS